VMTSHIVKWTHLGLHSVLLCQLGTRGRLFNPVMVVDLLPIIYSRPTPPAIALITSCVMILLRLCESLFERNREYMYVFYVLQNPRKRDFFTLSKCHDQKRLKSWKALSTSELTVSASPAVFTLLHFQIAHSSL